jgi:hypothetical protein
MLNIRKQPNIPHIAKPIRYRFLLDTMEPPPPEDLKKCFIRQAKIISEKRSPFGIR